MLYQLFDSITLQCLLQVCGLRTVHLTSLKNLICVDIVKCQVKFCLLIDFLYRFLTNLASTGGPHKISRRACGPRVGQHWSMICNEVCIPSYCEIKSHLS